MLVSRSKIITVLIICVLGVYFGSASFFDSKYLPHTKPNLGIDLKGGVSLLLTADSEQYIDDILKAIIVKMKINLKEYVHNAKIDHNYSIQCIFNQNKFTVNEIKNKISQIIQPIIGTEFYSINHIVNTNDQTFTLTLSPKFVNQMKKQLIERSIEVIHRRIDGSGTKEIDVQQQGDSSILLQIPGVYDTKAVRELLGKTAKLSFNIVDVAISPSQMVSGPIPFDVKVLPFENSNVLHKSETGTAIYKPKQNKKLLPIKIKSVIAGDAIIDAQPIANNGEYAVQFKLNNFGAKLFAEATAQNIGVPLAIVFDDKIISAPVINEPIPGGSGMISGRFTMQDAKDLAILLRSGSLPVKLNVSEERVIGPTLGVESIAAGTRAVIISSIAIMLSMILFYGIWGVFADIALLLNIFMIFAVLGILGTTLTMPGIAGIALTLGMAVDANVLILERMREEQKKQTKKRSVYSTIASGYQMAFITILDSNITTILAALLLYSFGSGPIKGFAVTLIAGILCSMFTATTLTKIISFLWCKFAKNIHLP